MDAYFDNVLIYNVQDALKVVKGTKFALNFSDTNVDVFANNDKVLAIDHDGEWVDVDALENGTSIIRFMQGSAIIKDLTIEIADAITRPATTLGGSLGEPEPK